MRKKTTFIFLALTVLGMAFASVNLVKAEFDDTIPFVYAEHTSPPGFDPQNFYDTTSSDVCINHLEGLYMFNYSDPALNTVPRLALDFGTWNEDGTEWTIPLRTDVLWHDGSAFTADDVVWNWDRLNFLANASLSQHASLWFNDDGDLMLNHTEALDDHTIKFVLNKEWKDFELLQSFAGCFMIKPIDGKEHVLIENDEYDTLIGTGPFILDDYVSGDKTVFVANNDYYRGAPDIQKLIFKIYASSTASNQALMAHEAHVDGYVLPDNRMAFNMDVDLEYFIQGGSCCYFYHLNVNNIDWAVRKAMQYAFNYEYLNTIFYDNNLVEHHSPVPDGMIGYNPDLPGLPYYDLTVARQYLKDDPTYGPLIDAAITGGFNESSDDDWIALANGDTFGTTTGPLAVHNFTHYGTGSWSVLIDNMKYIGVEIVDNVVGNWAAFLASNLADLEVVMGGWCPDYWAPINQIEPLFGTDASANYNGLANATIDTMMGEAHTLTGAELEAKIDDIVTAIIVEQAAAMYWSQNLYVIGWSAKYVSNVGDLFNAGGDKYFYNIEFALTSAPGTDDDTDDDTDDTGEGPGIPGFAMVSLSLAALGTVAFLLRKRN
jgi:ABC-type transport system substrate-binding protein